MIMQLCKGKELYDHLYQEHRKFSENDVRRIIRALLRAVAFLHSNFITHRDLKLENLLLENAEKPGSLRLCDFGLSTRFKRGEKLVKPLGTIDYVAPEVLDGDYNEKCDLWSVGVICFELLSGCRRSMARRWTRQWATSTTECSSSRTTCGPSSPQLHKLHQVACEGKRGPATVGGASAGSQVAH